MSEHCSWCSKELHLAQPSIGAELQVVWPGNENRLSHSWWVCSYTCAGMLMLSLGAKAGEGRKQ